MVSHSIAICAGEASGDLNGAHLAAALIQFLPDLTVWGAGGPKMRAAGVQLVETMTGGGTIGISETFKALPATAAKYLRLRRELLRRRPDLFVPIDYGAFNTRLAQIARKNGIGVVYYFPPSSWRKEPTNAAKLLACGGKVITPFPWSADFLGSKGVDARFVGHPLVDIVKPDRDKSEFLRELDLSDSLPTIGLLPGSRAHELREHLAPMIGCAEIIHRELGGTQFVMAVTGRADDIRRRVRAASDSDADFPAIRVVENRTYDCMTHSDFLIAKSGTATLEAAILGTPMVIVYRGTPVMRLEYRLRKSELGDHIGMPNIVAGCGICPELLNEDVTAEKIADIALGLLRDEARLAEMKVSLAEVRKQLGDSGAVERAARTLLEMGGIPSTP